MTPTDQTSTLEDIFGGSLPTTKHSGGKYLQKIYTSLIKHINFCLNSQTMYSVLKRISEKLIICSVSQYLFCILLTINS